MLLLSVCQYSGAKYQQNGGHSEPLNSSRSLESCVYGARVSSFHAFPHKCMRPFGPRIDGPLLTRTVQGWCCTRGSTSERAAAPFFTLRIPARSNLVEPKL